MSTTVQKPQNRVKKWYVRNERRILITTTTVATTVAVLTRIGLKQHDDFLREKGLYDEFYTPEEQ